MCALVRNDNGGRVAMTRKSEKCRYLSLGPPSSLSKIRSSRSAQKLLRHSIGVPPFFAKVTVYGESGEKAVTSYFVCNFLGDRHTSDYGNCTRRNDKEVVDSRAFFRYNIPVYAPVAQLDRASAS